MWGELPLDILGHVFSFLAPGQLAPAMATCRQWRASAALNPFPYPRREDIRPWFIAATSRPTSGAPCLAYIPELRRWGSLPLNFLKPSARVLSPVPGGLLLCRLGAGGGARLALCNPFTRQQALLPPLLTPRSSPAVGVVNDGTAFHVVVAGGAMASGYEPTVEVYDSKAGIWRRAGETPAGFAARLTVWTRDEGVVAGTTVYWMTAARAFCVMGLHVATGEWREVKVPAAERLQWAALVARPQGRLGLTGGCQAGEAKVWELRENDEWAPLAEMPPEYARRQVSAGVGGGGEVYLYGKVGEGVVVGREVNGRWSWEWINGCPARGTSVSPLKGFLFHPCLTRWEKYS